MIYNETRQFTFTQRDEVAFVATLPEVTVYKPDQSYESPTAGVTPGTLSLEQELFTDAVVLDMGGLWRIVWQDTIGNEVLHPTDYVFVSYTDLVRAIRLTLNQTPNSLSDEHLDLYISRIVRILELDYPLLPSYATLTGNDRLLIDEALALFVAAYLYPDILQIQPSGPLKTITIGTDDFQYDTTKQRTKGNEDDDWYGQALQIFSQISTVKDQFTKLYTSSLFVATGSRKSSRKHIGLADSLVPRYDLFSDARMAWDWNKIYASYFR